MKRRFHSQNRDANGRLQPLHPVDNEENEHLFEGLAFPFLHICLIASVYILRTKWFEVWYANNIIAFYLTNCLLILFVSLIKTKAFPQPAWKPIFLFGISVITLSLVITFGMSFGLGTGKSERETVFVMAGQEAVSSELEAEMQYSLLQPKGTAPVKNKLIVQKNGLCYFHFYGGAENVPVTIVKVGKSPLASN